MRLSDDGRNFGNESYSGKKIPWPEGAVQVRFLSGLQRDKFKLISFLFCRLKDNLYICIGKTNKTNMANTVNNTTATKQEFFDNLIKMKYEKIDTILNDEFFTVDDVESYVQFQDSLEDPTKSGYSEWTKFKVIIDKLKRCGINSVMVCSDVLGISKAAEGYNYNDRNAAIIKYYVVKTTWADVWVHLDGRTIQYIKYLAYLK